MSHETLAKALILTRGIHFTEHALEMAKANGAKGQNLVYNAPKGHRIEQFRPQELLLRGEDGYQTCVSAVAASDQSAVIADVENGKLKLSANGCEHIFKGLSETIFVPEPKYYSKYTSSGIPLTRLISACGVDEMNIWPWHDCAISKMCTFCGINKINTKKVEKSIFFTAKKKREIPVLQLWQNSRDLYFKEMNEALELAINDDCYAEHLHLILISGNLKNDELDMQASIYADISKVLNSKYSKRFTEGIVAVTAPPSSTDALHLMKDSGVSTVVFNLEAWMPDVFASECPGKNEIGRDHYLFMLRKAVDIYGWGHSWCNLVLGLDSIEDTLQGCEELASQGITPSANILHLDEGSRCKKQPPTAKEALHFFRNLGDIYLKYDLLPYYCQLALRTSLSNEAYAGRIKKTAFSDPLNLLP